MIGKYGNQSGAKWYMAWDAIHDGDVDALRECNVPDDRVDACLFGVVMATHLHADYDLPRISMDAVADYLLLVKMGNMRNGKYLFHRYRACVQPRAELMSLLHHEMRFLDIEEELR